MKKLMTLMVLLSTTASLYASDAAFTKAEAIQNCPVPATIQFTASTGSQYQGTFTGQQNGKNFVSWNVNKASKLTPAPAKTANPIDYRNNASTSEFYGYKSGDNTVCFYTVQKLIGGDYFMNMDTAHVH